MIVAVPVVTPLTTPEVLTVATPIALLVQLPPLVVQLSGVVCPVHNAVLPVMAAGEVLVEVVLYTAQLAPSEYVMVAVPALTPVTRPEDEPTVAKPVDPLVHTPPDMASVNEVLRPAHTLVAPEMGPGAVVTVTGAVA